MSNFSKFLHILKSKYAIASIIFLVLIIFFDRNNIFEQIERKQALNTLLDQKDFYQKEIDSTKIKINELRNNSQLLEKYARENLFMHKDSEEIFIFEK